MLDLKCVGVGKFGGNFAGGCGGASSHGGAERAAAKLRQMSGGGGPSRRRVGGSLGRENRGESSGMNLFEQGDFLTKTCLR
ncbi:hypothetical protein SLA2020_390400 [Shorea laevis]